MEVLEPVALARIAASARTQVAERAVRDALDALAACGGPGLIADRLRELGCRGRRMDPGMCPVAVYLEQVTGHAVRVGTITYRILSATPTARGVLPAAVGEFAGRFDERRYPELIA